MPGGNDMATIDLYENSTRSPTEVLADLDLSDEARELMPESANTFRLLHRLAEAELFSDSFAALARALPKHFAIVWARECMRTVESEARPASARMCLELVDRWLAAPDEAGRRRAAVAADEANYSHAEAWLAAAVGWSSGSLAPEGQAEVRPADHLTAVAVAACLSLLAAGEEDGMDVRSNDFIKRGLAMVAQPDPRPGS